MHKTKELIDQHESNVEFLRTLWLKTRDPKESEKIKGEMLDNQQTLARLKSGYIF